MWYSYYYKKHFYQVSGTSDQVNMSYVWYREFLDYFDPFYPFHPFWPLFAKCTIFTKNYITIIDNVLDRFEPNPWTQSSSKVQKPHFWVFNLIFYGLKPHFPKFLNNNTLHSRPFSAKSLDSIFSKNPKTSSLGYFRLFWAHLAQFGHKPDFFQKCDFRRMLEDH